jgi:PRTRC genetic system protein C
MFLSLLLAKSYGLPASCASDPLYKTACSADLATVCQSALSLTVARIVTNSVNLQRGNNMALTVTRMTRIFQFQGIRLPDPNPAMSVDEVKALYAAQYPELATAVVNGPEAAGDKMRYTFERAIGSKG